MKTVLHRTGELLGIQKDGVDFGGCQSRSLMFERFANPALVKADKENYFRNASDKSILPEKSRQWLSFLLDELALPASNLFYAQLQSRLLVNLAGGVMENAGISLDKLSGLPCIPGSAIRGCARRMAIQNVKDESDAIKKRTLLIDVALTFGWADEDWKTRYDHGDKWKDKRPDFACAAGEDLWHQAGFIASLQKALWKSINGFDEYNARTWEIHLSHYEGQSSFLPAYPIERLEDDALPLSPPLLGKLDLDVLTSHHPDYYSQKTDGQGVRLMPEARDVEDPVPVPFPAVSPGHVFVFSVRGAGAAKALAHLKEGLNVFGIGAKTNAGYGWFNTDPNVDQAIRKHIDRWHAAELVLRKDRAAKRRADEEMEAAKAAERERLEKLPTEERRAFEMLKLADEDFAAIARKYDALEANPAERQAFVLALKNNHAKTKRWAERKPDLLKPWQVYALTLNPPITLP